MCVASGSLRDTLFSRASFVGVLAGAAAPLLAPAETLAAVSPGVTLPAVPVGLAPGDARAAALASASPVVRAAYGRVVETVHSIGDASSRSDLTELLAAARPIYASRHPTPESRLALRDALAREGFVTADAPVAGIFPAGTDPTATASVQPFWSTPGSSEGSHHAYPGGLVVHELFNASMADAFATTYDRLYFEGRPTIDRDVVIAAALYHDIMKRVVFSWRDDGRLTDELMIAGTGAHHILSGAEALARGRDARFVTVLLSAHAAPSLGDEAKVAAWCRAAALVAGVDPIGYGLVRRDGGTWRLASDAPPLEAFINHLSDHDYVLSIHAMHVVSERLRERFSRVQNDRATSFPWYRSAVLTRTTALRLYDVLSRRGAAAFDAEVARTEAVLGVIG